MAFIAFVIALLSLAFSQGIVRLLILTIYLILFLNI